jgi:hypothetical protein
MTGSNGAWQGGELNMTTGACRCCVRCRCALLCTFFVTDVGTSQQRTAKCTVSGAQKECKGRTEFL